jgi:pseudouridine-5'-phosphate glycosidase
MITAVLDVRPGVADAVAAGRPVVALESTLIAHGLPWPVNVETARAAEAVVREVGSMPATIAVLQGRPTVGLTDGEIEQLAKSDGVLKASRRDLGFAVAQGRTAATTVSATMAIAHHAGIAVFATGGIGGVHRQGPPVAPGGRSAMSWDVSGDLTELARTPVAVVCAGAKSVLDLPATLEYLETLAVPVVGYGCDQFPAFYLTTSDRPVVARADDPAAAAQMLRAHWSLGGAGVVIAQPPPAELALDPEEFGGWLADAEWQAAGAGVGGAAVTPYLLARLAELSGGRTVELNRALIVANARLGAAVAIALAS